MKFNWEQSGMPASLVSRLKPRSEFAEFKAVLHEAQAQVMATGDAEAMARELVQSGGRDYVEMVRELSAELTRARSELESSNRRCQRLVAELARRGIAVADDAVQPSAETRVSAEPASPAEAAAEWEDWNRKFQALLD